MPIYEYECRKCGHRFEVIQKFSDAPVKKCEKCKGKTERLVSSPAIQFKGSGWYADGYSKKDSSTESKDAPATKDSKGSKDSKDSAKSKDSTSKETASSKDKPKSSPKTPSKQGKKAGSGTSGSNK